MSGSKSLVERGVIELECFLCGVNKQGLGTVAWMEVGGEREEESWLILIEEAKLFLRKH